jgi:hypothetical protein
MSPYRVIARRGVMYICQRVFGTYAEAVEHARHTQEHFNTLEIPLRP